MSVILQLTVGRAVSLGDAVAVAAEAERLGVAAIRLTDDGLDPTVVAAYLGGRHPGVGYIAEVPTTRHAPYNVARRVLSLDRATGGRIGVALRAGAGDEVSEAAGPGAGGGDPVARWIEYASVMSRLWESFPAAALVGDQEAGVAVDDTLIHPIHHDGTYYRVAGPLDGPSSPQGRPVLVADLGVLDAAAVAGPADLVVLDPDRLDPDRLDPDQLDPDQLDPDQAAGAADLLAAGVPLFGRVQSDVLDHERWRAWAATHRLSGVELVPGGGTEAAIAALRAWQPVPGAPAPTLRSALGLRELVTS